MQRHVLTISCDVVSLIQIYISWMVTCYYGVQRHNISTHRHIRRTWQQVRDIQLVSEVVVRTIVQEQLIRRLDVLKAMDLHKCVLVVALHISFHRTGKCGRDPRFHIVMFVVRYHHHRTSRPQTIRIICRYDFVIMYHDVTSKSTDHYSRIWNMRAVVPYHMTPWSRNIIWDGATVLLKYHTTQ